MRGLFISRLRKKLNISQDHVAKELGLSRPTYIKIEKDNAELSLSQASTLATILNISIEELMVGKINDPYDVSLEKVETKREGLQIRVTRRNLDKFKQVILYILNNVGGKPNVGETVIHKLLYFIDFDYYEKYEESLMGATYIKNHHGPTAVEFSKIISRMIKDEEIEVVQKSKVFTYYRKKYLPIKKPDLSLLSAREIEHIEGVLNRLSDKNAKEIEAYSHEDIPWKATKDGEKISYETVFYRDEKYSVRNYEDEI